MTISMTMMPWCGMARNITISSNLFGLLLLLLGSSIFVTYVIIFPRQLAEYPQPPCFADSKLGAPPAAPAASMPITHSLSPGENYTVVVLTHKRPERLQRTLRELLEVPHVASIIVVWNQPSEEELRIRMPNSSSIPVHIVPMETNSLNNRFKVHDLVTTEGVFNMDDDIVLGPEEVTFGFRAWQENRDRIVGFVGRLHRYDGEKYEYMLGMDACHASMALTGAAFLHKHYLYLYSNWMPAEIREHVDIVKNCEDIAMNFLIAHTIRRPPVLLDITLSAKQTTCSKCGGDNLSYAKDHQDERGYCLNYFTFVYGYLPLQVTMLRIAPPSAWSKASLPSSYCRY